MAKPKLEFGETEYQLTVNGKESDVTPYGDPIEFEGHIALMATAEDSLLSAMLFKVTPLADSEIDTEDVEFEGDGEDDDEDDDDAEEVAGV